jgi:hypothetical protein
MADDKKKQNAARQKKFRESKQGWDKVELDLRNKFAKKKSMAKTRMENTSTFKKLSPKSQAKKTNDWNDKYSNENLEKEIFGAKAIWEKDHGPAPEPKMKEENDKKNWSNLEKKMGKRFDPGEKMDFEKTVFGKMSGVLSEAGEISSASKTWFSDFEKRYGEPEANEEGVEWDDLMEEEAEEEENSGGDFEEEE